MSITISGHSDDLIEIEGDIREEFYATNDGIDYLAFSNGTVVSIEYTNGVWRIHPIVKPNLDLQIEQCSGDPDDDVYTDIATLNGVSWVVKGDGYVSCRK